MSEPEEFEKTSFWMPKLLHKRIKQFSLDHDMTDTQVFNRALTEFLKKEEKKK